MMQVLVETANTTNLIEVGFDDLRLNPKAARRRRQTTFLSRRAEQNSQEARLLPLLSDRKCQP
jgi:hypothetical protein